MKYLLDSNIFIQAKNFQYPFDSFPGFWEWLKLEMDTKQIASIIPVFKELTKGTDELVDWAHLCNEVGFFLPIDDEKTQREFASIASWAVDPVRNFKEAAYNEFLDVADSWLIAKAKAEGAVIVTLERYDPLNKKKILIPNVCRDFDIEYINTIELIRRLGVKFGIVTV